MSITALRTIVAATEEPITVAEAKAHLRVTYSAEDGYIQGLIRSATDWAQTFTRRILVNTQVSIRLDRFPESGEAMELRGDITGRWFSIKPNAARRKKEASKRDRSVMLPGGFVTAVNEIAYADELGDPQTLEGPTSSPVGTDYTEDLTDDEWAFVYPESTVGWPSVEPSMVNAVLVDYQAGWLSPLEVPDSIKQAIKFKVGDMFTIRDSGDAKNRSSLIKVAENLLEPYVVPDF